MITNLQIMNYLDGEGILHSSKNYPCLVACIQKLVTNPHYRNHIMDLYHDVAEERGEMTKTIEGGIRQIIRRSYSTGLSNREFLTRAADYLIFAQMDEEGLRGALDS